MWPPAPPQEDAALATEKQNESMAWKLFVECGGKKGSITVADFHRAMAGKRKDQLRPLLSAVTGPDVDWKSIVEQMDTNSDGQIDFMEFTDRVKYARR